MKYMLKTGFALFLSAAILSGAFPAIAFAANNEPVLTSICHASGVGAVSFAGGTSATLKVPYTHGTTINLSQGLDISYDTSVYSMAVPDFPGGSIATVGGNPVNMVVTYQRKGDSNLYTTSYSIKAVRTEHSGPAFSGTIAKTVTGPRGFVFTLADFADKYARNSGGELAAITITGSNPRFGTLKLGSDVYATGNLVSASDLANGRLTFVATGNGVVSYIVKAHAAGATDTAIGSVVLTITAGQASPSFSGTVTKTTSRNDNLTLALSDFSTKYAKNDGGDLAFITISGINVAVGKFKLGSSDYTADGAITVSDLANGRLTFVPAGEGTILLTVKAYAAGNETVPVGMVELMITVEKASAADISYSTVSGSAVKLTASDFERVCQDLTRSSLLYVELEPPSSACGKLFYDYSSSSDYGFAVSSSTRFYLNSSPYLSRVSFVPNAGYAGTASISYTVRNSEGKSLTGAVKIIVKQSSNADDVRYESNGVTPVTFDASDFNEICNSITNRNLSHVKFELPPSSHGSLYYGYTSSSDYDSMVKDGSLYYRRSSPYLSKVTFVPHPGHNGTVSIAYTGYSVDGGSYSGNVKVSVKATAGDISYTVSRDSKVTFDPTLFNEACKDLTGKALHYVQFNPPSSSYGSLHYGYVSSANTGSLVLSGTKHYRDSSPYISEVTFVPKPGYLGTVSIGYTGYNTEGLSYAGCVKVTVKDKEGSKHFGDVDKNYWWCADAVDYLFKTGVAAGIGSNRYNPAGNITRGDFILMLSRAFKIQTSGGGNFVDVDANSYYYSAISSAKALGIAKGDGERFRPTYALARQDAMVLVARAIKCASNITLKAGSSSDLAAFSDRDQIDGYATDAAALLVRAGVIQGTAGKLNPKGYITRAEMAVILHRIMTLN